MNKASTQTVSKTLKIKIQIPGRLDKLNCVVLIASLRSETVE